MSTKISSKLPEWLKGKSPDRIALIKGARVLMFNLQKLGIRIDDAYSLRRTKDFVLRMYPFPPREDNES
jgi:hypothetical protein